MPSTSKAVNGDFFEEVEHTVDWTLQIGVAVPVCSSHAAEEFGRLADKFVCLAVPQWFWAVGHFYWNFDQVSDEEIINYLLSSTLKTPQL